MHKTIEATKPHSTDKLKLAGRAAGVALAGVLATACGGSAHHEAQKPAAQESTFKVPTPGITPTVQPGGEVGPAKQAKTDLCSAIPSDVLKGILHKATVYHESGTYTCEKGFKQAGSVTYVIYNPGDYTHFRATDTKGAELAVAIQSDTIQDQNQFQLFEENTFAEPLTVDGHPAAWAPDGGILCVDAYENMICTSMAGIGTKQDEKQWTIEIAQDVLEYGF